MSDSPAILLIEDNEDDGFFTREMLREAFGERLTFEWVSDGEETRELIRERVHDVYLVDHDLGSCAGLELIREATGSAHPGAFILLTGQDSPEMDKEAMMSRATDYLVKGETTAPILARTHPVRRRAQEDRAPSALSRRMR